MMHPLLGRWSMRLALVLTLVAGLAHAAEPLVLARDGQPQAIIWRGTDATKAAKDLADNLALVVGAAFTVQDWTPETKVPADQPAILMGAAAMAHGLAPLPPSASGDSYRVERQGKFILLGGEDEDGTFFAGSHFLETLGCRFYFANPIGTVIPSLPTITVNDLKIHEQADFMSRSVWGPNFRDANWSKRNRLGGRGMSTGHSWGYISEKEFDEHPDYFPLRDDKRVKGQWLCTTHPDVIKRFSEGVARDLTGQGPRAISISPPDGTRYCFCDNCKALDIPDYREPSSNTVVMSDRYMVFFRQLAEAAAKANPQGILNFYAYADYSQPPKRVTGEPVPNLCVWMAPIRFCRLHGLTNELCPYRKYLRDEVLRGWRKACGLMGWREYNYNLAELMAPLSKISTWKHDIPLLKKMGVVGLNIECMFQWQVYGPHTWLITRMAWDADLDVDAAMDDFYTKFGEEAGPHLKAYWTRIDDAYRTTDIHVGSFYGLHVVWTPELVAACDRDLTLAAEAAKRDIVKQRVKMFRDGFESIRFYLAMRDAQNACNFVKAKEIYDNWMALMDDIHARKIHMIGEYKQGYAPRFLSAAVKQGAERVQAPHALVARLPDTWQFRYDLKEEGVAGEWFKEKLELAPDWRPVKTYSATLQEQKVPEHLALLWYRTTVTVPAIPEGRRAFVWFAEVDGPGTTLWLNGEEVGQAKSSRRPFEFEVTGKLRVGENSVVALVDHRRISELYLGGIIKPVMIYSSPPLSEMPPPEPKPAPPAKGKGK